MSRSGPILRSFLQSPSKAQNPLHPEIDVLRIPFRVGLVVAALASAATSRAQDLSLTVDLPVEGFVEQDQPIEIVANRPLAEGERLAVFFGRTDATDLFRVEPSGLRYDASGMPLPSGTSELIVYHVAGNVWTELARAPLRVRTPRGYDTARVDPTLDLSIKGRLDEGHSPAENAPPREGRYQDLGGQFNLQTEHVRNGVAIKGHSSLIGTSYRPEALRFGQIGTDAPKIDLSSYVIEYQQGDVGLSVGHVGFGNQPHLISGFNSRGTLVSYHPMQRVGFSFAAMNGSTIVGWKNFVGLDEPDHRLVGGTVHLEALPRPGALRVELTGLTASLLPQSGYNQGDVNDAEESEGLGVRIEASTPGSRMRMAGGWAQSRYRNPFDPTLAQGDSLVAVRRERKNARYLETNLEILQSVQLGETRTASLGVAFRHERVDPLYGSIGAYVRPDQLQNQWSLRSHLAGIDFQASHARAEDNLDDVESILKTRTRRTSGALGMPLAAIWGMTTGSAAWLPVLGYRYDRTHQFGTGVPPNSDFSESHVPDQVSVNQGATADWQWSRLSFGYRLDHSRQDNRQTGRELADLTNLVQGMFVGMTPHDHLRLDFEVSRERAASKERGEVVRTRRFGIRGNWSVFDRTTLTLAWALTHAEDHLHVRERDDRTLDAQWSSYIPGLDRVGGQYFLRFSRNAADARDREFDIDDERRNWSVDSGVNVSFF